MLLGHLCFLNTSCVCVCVFFFLIFIENVPYLLRVFTTVPETDAIKLDISNFYLLILQFGLVEFSILLSLSRDRSYQIEHI